MKTIIPYFIIIFICFITFSPQQNIVPSELETVKINRGYLQEKEHRMITKYGYTVFKQADKDIELTSLALAVIKAESRFDDKAKSHKGAIGLMQLMPDTAEYIGKKSGFYVRKKDLTIPDINIKLGIEYIRYLEERLKQIEDDNRKLTLILASYNSGLHRVKRVFKCNGFQCYIDRANLCTPAQFNNNLNNLPKETKQYLRNVKTYYTRYRNVFNST